MILLAILAGLATAPSTDTSNPCSGVETVQVTGLTIDAATAVPAGASGLPTAAGQIEKPFCRVQARIDDTIGIELWLPPEDLWNRHLLTGGVGGQAGYFNYRILGRAVNNGYIGATTDTGHKRGDSHWMLDNPVGVENFVERAHHRLAETARAFAISFYGQAVTRALFAGCSGGGRQGLIEAQRYPADYDGIIVGAPGPKTAEMSARRLWEMIKHRRFGDLMTQSTWDLIADRAVTECDADDGVTDGVVDDPRTCGFRIESLVCTANQSGNCLTPEQGEAARIIYGAMLDENGKQIDPGLLPVMRVKRNMLPLPGEKGKNVIALAIFGDLIHSDPDWDGMTFRIADDLPQVDKLTRLSPRDPVLTPFVSRGGKLIMYHGWRDSIVDPRTTIDYYNQVLEATPDSKDAVRLFMVPGMEHCSGGAGVDQFGGDAADPPLRDEKHNMLTAMELWLDGGKAPEAIIAARVEKGEVVKERPLCSYPAKARYLGEGSPDLTTSYACIHPGDSAETGQ